MADRRKRRPQHEPKGATALARKLALAPIIGGDPHLHGDDAQLIEPAWDGHRMLATRLEADVRLAALDHRDWTTTFPQVARTVGKLAARTLAIDGVVCVLDERGAPSFDQLRTRVAAGTVMTAVMFCWDLLWLDDEDLRGKPLAERRMRLAALLAGAHATLAISQVLDGDLPRVLAAVTALGLRGVVARRHDSSYDTGWREFGEAIDWRRSMSPPPPLTNADKVLYPRDGITKRDIVGFYRAVAPVLIAHMIDRPIVVQRWPDGIDEFDWYQHRMPPRAPDYLRAAMVDGVRRIVIENGDALLWMVNQAGLTYHAFASRLSGLAEPDYAMIDLDPGDRTTWWDETIEVALAVRQVLELLELPSVVKTSGQRGLHILVPLAPGHSFEQAEDLGRGVAELLLRLMPDKVTLDQEKDKRRGRLLVDHKQFMAKTLVLPYSLRAADGATVSTPIGWGEVSVALAPRSFTLRTVISRIEAKGDLATPLLAGTAQLGRALSQLRGQR
jgi:bifunctional non-homologous end joining protein LigD